MRTTLTIDDDVARLLDEAVHRERRPFKWVVNDALRRGLRSGAGHTREAYDYVPHSSGLRAGLDPAGFNRLADEFEDDAILDKARRSR
jgi:predicted transcriptional regulator